jgi:putative transcriptional regulator
MTVMMRLRLKADGRIVEILPHGGERVLGHHFGRSQAASGSDMPRAGRAGVPLDAAYARSVRARTKLTQAQFATSIGVPIETVRNWEQGKRSPRGPARALLRVIERAPDAAFAALRTGPAGTPHDR